jgi:hypothetical protein
MNLGKNILEDITPFLTAVLADAMDHQDWPDEAVFKISYRTKSWPEYAMGDTHHKYFTSMTDVKAWEDDYASWARLGGNSVEYTLYEWDLGPNVIKHNWY